MIANVVQLFDECQRRHIVLALEGDNVRVRVLPEAQQGVLDDQIRQAIKTLKPAIVMTLTAQAHLDGVVIDETVWKRLGEIARTKFPEADERTLIAHTKRCLLDLIGRPDTTKREKAHAAYCWWRLLEYEDSLGGTR